SPPFAARYLRPRHLPPFPTRRSSDLGNWPATSSPTSPRVRTSKRRTACRRAERGEKRCEHRPRIGQEVPAGGRGPARPAAAARPDRKSTRLNSSHVKTPYAVSCLKKT